MTKVYEVTLTPQQLATITVALEEAAKRAFDYAEDGGPEDRQRFHTFATLHQQMSEVARDFALVER